MLFRSMTQKPSGIGSHDAYSCPYKTVSDISNIPNASSLLLVCARIAIAVGVMWFYLKLGTFHAWDFFQAHSRHIPGTYQTGSTFTMPGTSQTVHDCKLCTIGRQSHTFSFRASFVIYTIIRDGSQRGNMCKHAHSCRLQSVCDVRHYHIRCGKTKCV